MRDGVKNRKKVPMTKNINEVSMEAWALVNEITDIIKPNEAYEVAQRYLDEAKSATLTDGYIYDLEQKIIALEEELQDTIRALPIA